METWKPVIGYEGIYEISNTGLVKSLSRNKHCGHEMSKPQITKERILTIRTDRLGYTRVKLSKNGVSKLLYLHRLIAKAFIENPKSSKEVNHIDGDKSNNEISNLEWCTRSENLKHAFKNGLKRAKKGEENNKAKLNVTEVKEIRKLYNTGKYTQVNIAKTFNVTSATISGIVNFNTWKEV